MARRQAKAKGQAHARGCMDRHRRCKRWATRNQCRVNPNFMLVNCPASCGRCGNAVAGKCEDTHPLCSVWARGRQCQLNPRYMMRNCQKSCGRCGGKRNAERTCECTATGDPHYRTYDGLSYSFQGQCKYILSESVDRRGACSFRVSQKNEVRDNNFRVTWTRLIDVEIAGFKIRVNQGKVVQINGQYTRLPWSGKRNNVNVKIYAAYFFVAVQAPECDLLVYFNGASLVKVEAGAKRYARKMSGLCGNCNGNINDDYLTKTGTNTRGNRDYATLIGDSFITFDDLNPNSQSCKTEPDKKLTCSRRMETLVNTRKYCGLLKDQSGPFGECLKKSKIRGNDLFANCKFDVCSVDNASGKQAAVCEHLEDLEEACNEYGFNDITWRSSGFCSPKCGKNMIFVDSSPACPETCNHVRNGKTPTCNLPPQPGCTCKDDYVRNGENCIHRGKCTKRTSDPCLSNPCIGDATCTKLSSSRYTCRCVTGYSYNHQSGCQDINECRKKPCGKGRCRNTRGSYRCVCRRGQVMKNGKCVINDPCAKKPCGRGKCRALRSGRYRCKCEKGFVYKRNKGCIDLDECKRFRRRRVCLHGRCVNTVGSYKCVCKPGYQINEKSRRKRCRKINYCRNNPCRRGKCRTIRGGYTCKCRPGYTFDDKRSCRDINECKRNGALCKNGECINTDGGYSCNCDEGYNYNKRKHMCESIDRCKSEPCGNNGQCLSQGNSYNCVCDSGYTFVRGKDCTDKNECRNRNICGKYGKCVNKIGGYQCRCKAGYEWLRQGLCVDKDECKDVTCENGVCENKPGSYKCMCNKGYEWSKNDRKCVDKNECKTGNPCGKGQCINHEAGYNCSCMEGYRWDRDKGCVDINECTDDNPCHKGECRNTPGSYKCLCEEGLIWSEETGCTDIDECKEGNLCSNGVCVNTRGSYTCECKDGFRLKGSSNCVDIDECEKNVCRNGTCVNVQGTFNCKCPIGHTWIESDGCVAIDYCEEDPCSNGICISSNGSYVCKCNSGYENANNKCIDIDECDGKNSPCGGGECENSEGSYTCVCPEGKKWERNEGCVGINECLKSPCSGNAKCVDTEKSYECSCSEGFEYKHDEGCVDIDECLDEPCSGIADCKNKNGGHECVCMIGFEYIHKKGCVDINECLNRGCMANASCTNLPGSFKCECKPGQVYDNKKGCTLYDNCIDDPCYGNSKCKNVEDSFECTCESGFEYDGDGCVDINECDSEPCSVNNTKCINLPGSFKCKCDHECLKSKNPCLKHPCGPNATCENESENFKCNCDKGYIYTNRTSGCVNVNECKQTRCEGNSECKDTVGGFICVCPSGFRYKKSEGCVDINECLNSPCVESAKCNNTDGAYICSCKDGLFYNSTSGCEDINECDKTPCASNATCMNKVGEYQCQCPKGFRYNKANGCVDVDECTEKPCSDDSKCVNVIGAFRCECPTGFSYGREQGCADNDECEREDSCIGSDTTCINTRGSFRCVCTDGYTYKDNMGCVDTNECKFKPCGNIASCKNLNGSYTCKCPTGYVYHSQRGCEDVNECEDEKLCIGNALCVNTIGSYTCKCNKTEKYSQKNGCIKVKFCKSDVCRVGSVCNEKEDGFLCTCQPGFKYNKHLGCIDVNECETGDFDCKSAGNCKNTIGSYKCKCKDGYVYNNKTGCVDKDECRTSPCRGNSKCVNTDGGFECNCDAGFKYNVHLGCLDIDECSTGDKLCPQNGKCVNTIGSYKCACPNGYTYNDGRCKDTNECETKPCRGEESVKCVNTDGGFRCQCSIGYTYNVHFGCIDIDECKNKSVCSGDAKCVNNVGGYKCMCQTGYNYIKSEGCNDIDECETNICKSDVVICSNTPGSYKCSCPKGMEYRNETCQKIDMCEAQGNSVCKGKSTCKNLWPKFECICNTGYVYSSTKGCVVNIEKGVQKRKADLYFVVDACDGTPRSTFNNIKTLIKNTIEQYVDKNGELLEATVTLLLMGNNSTDISFQFEDIETVDDLVDDASLIGGQCNLNETFNYLRNLYTEEGDEEATRMVFLFTSQNITNNESGKQVLRQNIENVMSEAELQIVQVGSNGNWSSVLSEEFKDKRLLIISEESQWELMAKLIYEKTVSWISCPTGFVEENGICNVKSELTQYCNDGGKLKPLNYTWSESCVTYKCTASGITAISRKCLGLDGDCYALLNTFFPCVIKGKPMSRCRCKMHEYVTAEGSSAEKLVYQGTNFIAEDIETTSGKKCIFPFKYNNAWHYRCIAYGSGKWCALDKLYVKDRWTYCKVRKTKNICLDPVTQEKHEEGDSWMHVCNTMTCTRTGLNIEAGCRGTDGVCRALYADNYSCQLNNQTYERCMCTANSNMFGINEVLSGVSNKKIRKSGGGIVKLCTDKASKTDHAYGTTWKQKCFQYKCTEKGITIVDKQCESFDGTCVAIGKEGFTCRIKKKKRTNCKCSLSKKGWPEVSAKIKGEKVYRQEMKSKSVRMEKESHRSERRVEVKGKY